MEIWQQTKGEYVKANVSPDFTTRYWTLLHRNAVASALGESKPVPARVLADYRSYDFASHPQYKHGSNPAPLKPKAERPDVRNRDPNRQVGFYEVALGILASEMTGFENED